MKKICVSVFEDTISELEKYQLKYGANKTWIINEALKQYLGIKDNGKIYLDIADVHMSAFRKKCITEKTTINEIINNIIKKEIDNASTKEQGNS